MRVALLGVAASLAVLTPSAPAGAQALAFSGQSSPSVQSVSGHGDGFRHDRRRHDRRRHRDSGDTVLIVDRDYQGDTAWRADSYNDWWHERPHRAYPAWMARNQNCERMYWSGGGWRC
jgi:hypothetical protein